MKYTNQNWTAAELQAYEKGWTAKMVEIWQERMDALGIYDTGRLRGSVGGTFALTEIRHHFLEYGLYVAAGVGYGYEHDNDGDLLFLDKAYRHEYGLDKPRKRGPGWGGGYTSGKPRRDRDWFSRKYLYSLHRLNETEGRAYGEMYNGMLATALDTVFSV